MGKGFPRGGPTCAIPLKAKHFQTLFNFNANALEVQSPSNDALRLGKGYACAGALDDPVVQRNHR